MGISPWKHPFTHTHILYIMEIHLPRKYSSALNFETTSIGNDQNSLNISASWEYCCNHNMWQRNHWWPSVASIFQRCFKSTRWLQKDLEGRGSSGVLWKLWQVIINLWWVNILDKWKRAEGKNSFIVVEYS